MTLASQCLIVVPSYHETTTLSNPSTGKILSGGNISSYPAGNLVYKAFRISVLNVQLLCTGTKQQEGNFRLEVLLQ